MSSFRAYIARVKVALLCEEVVYEHFSDDGVYGHH